MLSDAQLISVALLPFLGVLMLVILLREKIPKAVSYTVIALTILMGLTVVAISVGSP